MQMNDLKMEHLNFLLKSFILGIDVVLSSSIDENERKDIIRKINDFIPKLKH